MRFIMLLLVVSLISCGVTGDSITKANDLSQVVESHFEYSKIKMEFSHSEGIHAPYFSKEDRFADYYVTTGRIKNKSGINIREAYFWAHLYDGNDELDSQGFVIDDFIDNTTRDFNVTNSIARGDARGQKPDRVAVTFNNSSSR